MKKKFEFNIQESLNAIDRVFKIAENYDGQDSFEGQLAKCILELNFHQFFQNLHRKHDLLPCQSIQQLDLHSGLRNA